MGDNNQLRANITPADIAAIAISCFGFFGLLGGSVKESGIIIMAAWLFGGAILQIIAALFSVLKGNGPGANLGLIFSCYLMLTGAVSFAIKYIAAVNQWPIDASVEGYLWMPIWFCLWLWTPAFFKTTPLTFNLVIIGLDIVIPLMSLGILGVWAAGMALVPWVFLFTGIFAIWTAGAMLLGETFQRPIIPVGSPLIKS